VMERGSVEGELFHRGAVAVLTPDPVRDEVESHLTTLVRKELIRSAPPTFPDDEGFRFRHLLIRDAAYESLPKATRAELHERFADWLGGHGLVERDEVMGYHLEQAHRYRAELDPSDPGLVELARRASEHLALAGRGALERADGSAGRVHLQRAFDLLPEDDDARSALAPDLCEALRETGDLESMRMVLASARRSPDAVVRAKALVLETRPDFVGLDPPTDSERAAKRDVAFRTLDAAGDDEGLALYWEVVARGAWYRLRAEETASALERALTHAERAGSRRRAREAASWIPGCFGFGPVPVSDAIRRTEELRAGFPDALLIEAHSSVWLGVLAGMQGEFERGRQLVRAGIGTFEDAGLPVTAGGMSMGEAWVEYWGGDPDTAEGVLRSSLRVLGEFDERGYRPTIALHLADLLYEQGRLDEAEDLCRLGRDLTTPDDLINFIYVDMIEGGLCAHRGKSEDALERLRQAVQRSDGTDFYWARAASRVRLAEVLALAGCSAEAGKAAAAGLAGFAAKGDIAGAALTRARLVALGIEVS